MRGPRNVQKVDLIEKDWMFDDRSPKCIIGFEEVARGFPDQNRATGIAEKYVRKGWVRLNWWRQTSAGSRRPLRGAVCILRRINTLSRWN